MPKIKYIDQKGNSKTINVENGLTVMEGAVQNNIPGIDADCGGSMACATCHVYVEDSWFNKILKAEDAENILNSFTRLETITNTTWRIP